MSWAIRWMSPVAWGARPGQRAAAIATVIVATVGAGYGIKVVTDTSPPPAGSANVWVDTNGGTCTRQGTAGTYVDAAACGSFSAAYSIASGGDTVRCKSGSYPKGQSFGGSKTPTITLVCEEGAVVVSGRDSRSSGVSGMSINGNVSVSNLDVGGPEPFIYIGGSNSTWRDSTMLESSDSNTYPGARGTATGSTPEPILVYSCCGDPQITNASIINVVVEAQHVCSVGVGDCGSGDVYHLEAIRIDENVNGLTLDRMTFEDGGEYTTSQVFVTTLNTPVRPQNLTIKNSVFGSTGTGNPNFDGGSFNSCTNWVFAYNTFRQSRTITCTAGSSVTWVGNVGPKSGTGDCISGSTWTKNVWQDTSDTRCGGSTDTWVNGTRFDIDALDLDSDYRPLAGSPVVDAAETGGGSAYCTDALGSVDRDGDTRPVGTVCDAGAFER